MSTTALLLSKLSDRELAHRAWLELDALTSTDLERELLTRFEAQMARDETKAAIDKVLDDFGLDETKTADLERIERALNFEAEFDPATYRPLLDLLAEFDIDSPEPLRRILERDTKVSDLVNDLAAPLARLQSLTTPA